MQLWAANPEIEPADWTVSLLVTVGTIRIHLRHLLLFIGV